MLIILNICQQQEAQAEEQEQQILLRAHGMKFGIWSLIVLCALLA